MQVNDVLKVLPGASIPADGVIIENSRMQTVSTSASTSSNDTGYYIDNSLITGESLPVLCKVGDFVYGSTINVNHVLYLR